MEPETAEPLEEERPLNYSFWMGALILKGSIAPRVIGDIIKFGLIAELIVLVSVFVEWKWNVSLAIPHGPFSAAGAVLGLLLVLRTNAGYDRWWEARKLWGGIVNQSRNLGVIALAYGPRDAQWRTQFVTWMASFPHVIRYSLRDERSLPDVAHLVGPAKANLVSKAKHMPTCVARILADLLQDAKKTGMDSFAFLQAEQQRSEIVNHLGGCERIRNTPLARASAIQVRQFIFLFLVTLPFASLGDFSNSQLLSTLFGIPVEDSILLTPLFIMLMAWPLLSLDRIGMELQNPFDTRRTDHLPIDAICHTIEKNLMQLLKTDSVVAQEGLEMESREITPEMAARIAKGKSNDTIIS